MSNAFRELSEVRVTIDKVVYVPTLEAPPDRPYPFVYFITIRNDSPENVTIRGRKWVVTDSHGGKLVVEGDGVVGEFPGSSQGKSSATTVIMLLQRIASPKALFWV